MEPLMISDRCPLILSRGCLFVGIATTSVFCTAHAETAVTPEQHFPPGYLESVAAGYENGQAALPPAADETIAPAQLPQKAEQEAMPNYLSHASFLVAPQSPVPASQQKKHHK